jgi:hypothetical protein
MSDPLAELVRINEKGEAHPIGVVASRRMRDRQGAFRVLPAPKHIVLMRYTGEDGRRDAEDGPVVRLSGEITAPCALLDVLAMLAQTRAKGQLSVLTSVAERNLFLENGNIVGIETSVEEERLGRVMYRYGALDEAQHQSILARTSEGLRFGQAAVELELVSRERVYLYLGKQIEEVVYACLGLDDGAFFFLDGLDHQRLASHHAFSVNGMLMDVVTRMDEMRYFRQKIPDESWIPLRADRQESPVEEFCAALEAVDGQRSIADIGRITGAGEFHTTKAIYALMRSHHVTLHPPRLSGGAEAIVVVANAALTAIHARVDGAGAGDAFRRELAGFTAGAGIYDMIFRGAGPRADGSLDAERVAENVATVAGGDPEDYLQSRLHDYVSFALFSAESTLGSADRGALEEELAAHLGSLQPHG